MSKDADIGRLLVLMKGVEDKSKEATFKVETFIEILEYIVDTRKLVEGNELTENVKQELKEELLQDKADVILF